MREDLLKRKMVPIGSREWLERLHASQEPDWHNVLPRNRGAYNQATPEIMQQFWREIGRRGGLQRSRNYALRSVSKGIRFWQRYGSNPNEVKAAPVMANETERRYLHAFASRGGQARARRYPKETLRAWAAKGGHAKAAKSKQASSPTHDVAGKQARVNHER